MKLLDRINQLISTPSVSSVSSQWDTGNIAVIELLATWFNDLGFTTNIQHIDKANGKANLIATYGQGPGGLILAGHTDTVPFNESRWNHDPLKLTENDNRLYGLGTADMKSFFSLVLEAVLPLLEHDFKAPLIILATADEESSMSGARALAQANIPKARAAIIGEPTGLKPINMHKGIMMQGIKLTGQSGHSSDPSLGNNAIDAMHDVISELKQYRQHLKDSYQNSEFNVAFPTMNLGCIHGGDNPNRICNSCELHFDLRGLPGMNNEALKAEIVQRIQPIVDKHAIELDFIDLFEGVEAFAQERDSELVTLAEKLTGTSSEAVAFATEAPFLKAMDINTIVLGPGYIDQAHQPDEYLPLNQIEPYIQLLQRFIRQYCL